MSDGWTNEQLQSYLQGYRQGQVQHSPDPDGSGPPVEKRKAGPLSLEGERFREHPA
jgi:hypothetical protein